MTYQPQLDFTQVVHERENNSQSQSILEENRPRLNKGCETVHKLLLQGVRLNPDNFSKLTGQTEYRRRFADLIKAGYPVQFKNIGGGKRERFYEQDYINSKK